MVEHDIVLFEARNPRGNIKEIETPEAMSQAFSAFSTVLGLPWWKKLFILRTPPRFIFELVVFNQTVRFFAGARLEATPFVESQISAHYPRVLLVRTKDYLPSLISSFPHTATGRLTLSKAPYYPLRTFRDYRDVDPLAPIVGTLAKLGENEAAVVQFVLTSAGGSWQSQGVGAIEKGLTDATGTHRQRLPAERIIQNKISQPGLLSTIRILACAQTPVRAGVLRGQIASSFGSVANGEGNTLVLRRPWFGFNGYAKKRLLDRKSSWFNHTVLNSEELASLWHPPSYHLSKIKNIAWGNSFLGEAPENLPVATELDSDEKKEINFFARADYKNKLTTFGIKKVDRRRHVYVIGKTGVGKSTVIANMAINDMRNGEGMAVIDPHGDLCETLLDFVPSHRINDVIYLDPSDSKHPFHLNPLETLVDEHRELVASGIVSIFHKLYEHSWGPRLEYILRNTLLTLLRVPHATLLGIPELLTNQEYRRKTVEKLDDPVLKSFWLNEFEAFSPQMKSEVVSPILNKVGQFLSSTTIRNIIGSPVSTIHLEDVMNKGKILLVNLSQGKLGEDSSALLGAMIITKLQLAAMNRVHVGEADRRDFYLYVDEFQNFATTSFIKILSEARKYRLNLTLANQYIGQVDEEVQKAIFGNTGTLIAFLVGARDSYLLAKEFGQVFTEEDLVSLGNYQIMLKLAIDNLSSRPFFATTLPLPKSRNQNREKVLKVSRERYTKKIV